MSGGDDDEDKKKAGTKVDRDVGSAKQINMHAFLTCRDDESRHISVQIKMD